MAQVDIGAWAKKVGGDLGEAVVAIKLELFSGVILATRVDTGRLRGNWQTQTGAPITTETDRLDPNGSAAIDEVVKNITPSGVDYLTNNLSYAAHWNERDGIIDGQIARVVNNIKRIAKR